MNSGSGDRYLQGDFNGDGRTDICSVGQSENARWVGLSDGDGTFTFTTGYDVLDNDLSVYFAIGNSVILTGDFDGDGMTDIIGMGNGGGSGESQRWLGLSDGDGTFTFTKGYDMLPEALVVDTLEGGSVIQTGDFNGDGLTDIFSVGQNDDDHWLGLSDGDGTFTFTTGYDVLDEDLLVYVGEGGGYGSNR